MNKGVGNSKFYAVSMLVGTFLFSSCMASNLELQADTPPQTPAEAQSGEVAPAPLRAIHPSKMRVSLDEEAEAITIELSFDPCKAGGFVYDKNSLEVDVDHSDRTVTLKGSVEYIEHKSDDDAACASRPQPIVIVSENAQREPYLILNRSAWMGRAGNGLKGRVLDFRTPARIDAERRACLSQDGAEIGDISGVWFLQSDPSKALSLSASASTMTPEAVMPVWVGSYRPWMINSDAPYKFNLSSFGGMAFGNLEFQSPTCALVYDPRTGERTDILVRQTPEEF